MPNVVDSLGVKIPFTAPVSAFCASRRLSPFENALSVVAPPYWLSLTTLMAGLAFTASRKPFSRFCVLAEPSW